MVGSDPGPPQYDHPVQLPGLWRSRAMIRPKVPQKDVFYGILKPYYRGHGFHHYAKWTSPGRGAVADATGLSEQIFGTQ